MRAILFCVLLVLASCRKNEPPAPTPEQSAELNDADAMLNNVANEEGPANRSAGPSNSSE
jgi:hypothetical protein